jgi:hypothetical protein
VRQLGYLIDPRNNRYPRVMTGDFPVLLMNQIETKFAGPYGVMSDDPYNVPPKWLSPDNWHFIPYPGQTADALESLIGRFRKLAARAAKSAAAEA